MSFNFHVLGEIIPKDKRKNLVFHKDVGGGLTLCGKSREFMTAIYMVSEADWSHNCEYFGFKRCANCRKIEERRLRYD